MKAHQQHNVGAYAMAAGDPRTCQAPFSRVGSENGYGFVRIFVDVQTKT